MASFFDGNNDSGSRKRSKKSLGREDDFADIMTPSSSFTGIVSTLGGVGSPCSTLQHGLQSLDRDLFNHTFSNNEFETLLATAIFELGLKHSSPKVLIPFMPPDSGLSTEHIKSHLQKYRIHKNRSKEEFCSYFDSHVKEAYRQWEQTKSWEKALNLSQPTVTLLPTATSSSSTIMSGSSSTNKAAASLSKSNSSAKLRVSTSAAAPNNQQQLFAKQQQQALNRKRAKEEELNRTLQTLLQVHHSLVQMNMQVNRELQTYLPGESYGGATAVHVAAPVPSSVFPPPLSDPYANNSMSTHPFHDLFTASRNVSNENLLVDDSLFNPTSIVWVVYVLP